MARTYKLGKRADRKAETRQRIVEAAVDLHGSVGPAATSLSMVAERAGVQRHTLYAHFPRERLLFEACSGLTIERDPMPDPRPWREIADPGDKLRTGLDAIYGWYERNAQLAACVLRDAEHHALTRDIVEEKMGPPMAECRAALGHGLPPPANAMLGLAMSFATWRTLTRDEGLSSGGAAEAMTRAVTGAV